MGKEGLGCNVAMYLEANSYPFSFTSSASPITHDKRNWVGLLMFLSGMIGAMYLCAAYPTITA